MPGASVAGFELTPAEPAGAASGERELLVRLEDGRASRFRVATFDRPEAWAKAAKDGAWGPPVLLVASLDRAVIAAALDAMAGEMGGYWLRYYNSGERPARGKK